MEVKKVHKVRSFEKKLWFKEGTDRKKEQKSAYVFLKDFRTLLNFAFHRKSVESVHNRLRVVLKRVSKNSTK